MVSTAFQEFSSSQQLFFNYDSAPHQESLMYQDSYSNGQHRNNNLLLPTTTTATDAGCLPSCPSTRSTSNSVMDASTSPSASPPHSIEAQSMVTIPAAGQSMLPLSLAGREWTPGTWFLRTKTTERRFSGDAAMWGNREEGAMFTVCVCVCPCCCGRPCTLVTRDSLCVDVDRTDGKGHLQLHMFVCACFGWRFTFICIGAVFLRKHASICATSFPLFPNIFRLKAQFQMRRSHLYRRYRRRRTVSGETPPVWHFDLRRILQCRDRGYVCLLVIPVCVGIRLHMNQYVFVKRLTLAWCVCVSVMRYLTMSKQFRGWMPARVGTFTCSINNLMVLRYKWLKIHTGMMPCVHLGSSLDWLHLFLRADRFLQCDCILHSDIRMQIDCCTQ